MPFGEGRDELLRETDARMAGQGPHLLREEAGSRGAGTKGRGDRESVKTRCIKVQFLAPLHLGRMTSRKSTVYFPLGEARVESE